MQPFRAPHLFLGLMTNLVLRGSWIFDMRTDLLHYSMCLTSLFLYVLIMLTRQIKCQSICSRESVDMVKRITVELSKVVLCYLALFFLLYEFICRNFRTILFLLCFCLRRGFSHYRKTIACCTHQLQQIMRCV